MKLFFIFLLFLCAIFSLQEENTAPLFYQTSCFSHSSNEIPGFEKSTFPLKVAIFSRGLESPFRFCFTEKKHKKLLKKHLIADSEPLCVETLLTTLFLFSFSEPSQKFFTIEQLSSRHHPPTN